jgi:hypothetical protein
MFSGFFGGQKRKQAPKGLFSKFGGKGEIRTHGTPKGTLDFESSAFDHSATFPGLPTHRQRGQFVRSKRVVAWERKIIEQLNPISKPLDQKISKGLGKR